MGVTRVCLAALCAAILTAGAHPPSLVSVTARASARQAAQQPAQQPPVFRAGVELLSVDVTVVDGEGRQVTDLRPQDFIVEVDGNARSIISAEYIKLVDDAPIIVGARRTAAPVSVSPDEGYFSTNTRALSRGRLIVLIVDQGNIRSGHGREVMRSAVKFVDGLSPDDRVALIGIPGPGTYVDFTTNHERIREGLLATVGHAQPFQGRFHISLSEAFATAEHSDAFLRAQVILRECGGPMTAAQAIQCEIEVEQECAQMVSHQRNQTQSSLRGMTAVLQSLAAFEGPKSVIVISEGLVLENNTADADLVASVAADARASLDVMLLDIPSVDVTERQRPTTPREDRDMQVAGLEMIAAMSRGALHRIVASGDQAFVRIMRSMAGHYLLGVESRASDRDGKRHRIQVKSNRRGVTMYSRRGFLAPTSPAATSPADAVTRALRAPLTMNDVRMRVATWTYKEPGGSRVRLLIAAEVERASEQPLEYTTGIVLFNRDGKSIASTVEARKLSTSDANSGVAVYAGSLLLDPGTYLLRLAVADSEGRMGSVERKLEAWQMNRDRMTLGDLLVGEAPTAGQMNLVPAIEPIVSNGRLAALMEIYAPNAPLLQDVKATFEVLPAENAKPVATGEMAIVAGPAADVRTIHGLVNTAALPPGRYFARTTITQAGKAQGHFVRPFRVTASTTAAPAAAGGVSVPSVLPRELTALWLADLPLFDKQTILAPAVLSSVFAATEKSRPTAGRAVFEAAKNGKLGAAALDALAAGDQAVAALLRGVDFFAQGQNDRALQQLQVALQQAPGLSAARLYLGASLLQSNRHREAASLLQSVPADLAGPAIPRLAGISWLRAGEISLAIDALEQAAATSPGDASTTRALAMAYIVGNRPVDAAPLLTRYLESNATDQAALLAGLYTLYATHSPSARAETIAADRAKAQTWAKAYGSQRGAHQGLVDAWVKHLQGLK